MEGAAIEGLALVSACYMVPHLAVEHVNDEPWCLYGRLVGKEQVDEAKRNWRHLALNLLELAHMSVVEYCNWVELEMVGMSCMPGWKLSVP